MIKIREITQIDKKRIAIMDTSSISFMHILHDRGISSEYILKDYDLILIPHWVLTEINDSEGRTEYVQYLIDTDYPIYSIAEENYSSLTEYEDENLYQIVLASVAMLGRVKAYLRRYVEQSDSLEMEPYRDWISRLYDEWPFEGTKLSNGREKKNAGEVSITILSEVLSWYYPDTEELTVYTNDRDAFIFHEKADLILRERFSCRTPVHVSYKSNDAILCQLYRDGIMDDNDIIAYRGNARNVTYSKEMADHSTALVTELVNNEYFVELAQDISVHIVF